MLFGAGSFVFGFDLRDFVVAHVSGSLDGLAFAGGPTWELWRWTEGKRFPSWRCSSDRAGVRIAVVIG